MTANITNMVLRVAQERYLTHNHSPDFPGKILYGIDVFSQQPSCTKDYSLALTLF
jgi:hypothetical protein